MSKILVIVGGSARPLEPFLEAGRKLGVDVAIASFSDIEYFSEDKKGRFVLRVKGKDIVSFDVVYIRMIGKRLEDATLVAGYAKENGVRVVDRLYEKSLLMPLSLSKAIETKRLIEAGIPIPATLFGSLRMIKKRGRRLLGFPYVIKSTTGKKAREVWSPRTSEKLDELIEELKPKEKSGGRFFAQSFTRASQRIRVFVIGGMAIAAITRPTRWRKRFLKKVGGEYPEGRKEALSPIPEADAKLAIKAARAAFLDIAGVDIVHEDESGEPFVLEVNSAPRWGAVSKDTGLNIEEEVLKFLSHESNRRD